MRRTLAIDGLGAAVLLAAAVLLLAGRGVTTGEAVLSVLMTAPLAARRVAPAPALAAVLVVAAVSLVVSDRVIPGDPAPLVALFSVVAHDGRDRVRLAAVVVLLAGALPTGARWAGDAAAWAVAGAIGVVAVHVLFAAALGELRRQALRRAADRLRRAAEDERARIARELHDVVAHALAVVVVQADAGRFAAAADPAAAEGTLRTIGETARTALTDMRAALGALREPAQPTPGGWRHTNAGATVSRQPPSEERAPQPGIGDVDALVARLRAAGLAVDLAVEGDARPVPAATGLAVYRVVQEALTNAVKHAGDGATVRVRVAHGTDAVEVTVADDGAGRPLVAGGDGAGSGLAGMRERVSVAGGTLEAGPHDGGWRVRARIPA